ncbi:MAG: hypothetical protein WC822_07445, partial [Candidatus Paceibacterota bacterium]
MTLTAPTSTAIWRITEVKTISWEVDHGQLDYVKIVASKSGNFTGGADEYDVVTQRNPFNDEAFNVSLLPAKVGSGSYAWTIPETTPLLNTMRFKVIQDNASFTDIISAASAAMDIRANITVVTPPADWQKGDTNRTVTFTPYGTGLGTVYIFLYSPDDNAEYQLDGGSGVATAGDGNQQVFNVPLVPDAKSLSCVLRVRDTAIRANSKVEGISNAFKCYPVISTVAITPTNPPNTANVWIADAANQAVTWSVNGSSQIDAVDIYYSPTGTGGFNFTTDTPIVDNWSTAQGSCGIITVPHSRTTQGRIAVRDADSNFANYVNSMTQVDFRVCGKVYIDEPLTGHTWKVGETDKLVKWHYDGNLSTVNIDVNYGSGWSSLATNIGADLGAAGYNLYPTQWASGVPDQVSNNVQFRIKDSSASYNDVTTTDSQAFAITGGLTFAYPLGGETFHVTSTTPTLTVRWNTTGTQVTRVKLEYWNTNDNSGSGGWRTIKSDIVNGKWGPGAGNENTYPWDISSPEPIPLNLSSTGIKFRLTASTPDQPSTAKESSTFVMCGELAVTAPAQGATWVANGSTANTISWNVYGSVTNVKILYSRNSGTDWTELVSSMSAEAGDAAANKGAYLWTIPTDPAQGDFITRVDAPTSHYSVIKVQDASSYGTYVTAESLDFKVKGQLRIVAPASGTLSSGLACATPYTVTCERDGRVNSVNIKYSTNGGSSYNVIENGITFSPVTSATQASTTLQWTVPETPVNATYRIMAEDAAYIWPSGTFGETADFRVKGALTLTAPTSTAIWRINETDGATMTWDVNHGQLLNAKVIASPSGNFGADIYTVANISNPFNVVPFNSGNSPVGKGSYTWTLPVTTQLVNTIKFKVVYDETGYPNDVMSGASAAMDVRANVSVVTPSVDWQKGDINRTVTFTPSGTGLGTVYIFLYSPDDNAEYQLDGGSGVATAGDGNQQVFNVPLVPDA